MSSARRLTLAIAAIGPVLAGCSATYLDTNAPGIADVREPPKEPSREHRVEVPRDPGGHVVVLSYGLFAGAGGAVVPADGGRASYAVGAELSLAKGVTHAAHPDMLFYPTMEWAYGINLGFTAVRALGEHVGPLYAEAEVRSGLVALAAGWTYAPVDRTHGPQATLALGPFFLRGTHELDLGTQIHFGILLKGFSAWAWSR